MASMMWKTRHVVQWSQWLLDSYRHWTGRELIDRKGEPEGQAGLLFQAPFVVVSHGVEADPVLNYGNRTALDLWETTWEQLVKTPSRLTAEPVNQPERQQMLEIARSRGFFDGYRGVRVSMTGRRFLVEHALIWTVMDTAGDKIGQAATFSQWTRL
jgi:hypothetical protein